MKYYTYTFLGYPRCGTTSLWTALGKHTQISASRHKERLHFIPEDVPNLNFYVHHGYNLKDNTKVLLDGTPYIFRYKPRFVKLITEMRDVDRTCCVFPLRDDKERVMSFLKHSVVLHYRLSFPRPWFIDDNDQLIPDNTLTEVKMCLSVAQDIIKIEEQIGKENIFLVDLNKINDYSESIQEFLGVEIEDIHIEKLNKIEHKSPTLDAIRIFNSIKDLFEREGDTINQIIDTNLEEIHKRYKIHE
jgi:hypothetical protein